MKAAGLIAASAAVATVVDLGTASQKEGQARFEGRLIIDATAVEVATGDELYDIVLQGTNTAAFTDDTDIVDLCSLTLGDATQMRSSMNQDGGIGRYELLFTNVYAGTAYRYIRLYTVVAGTIATGINYKAYIGAL
jgi:hypothetical protein